MLSMTDIGAMRHRISILEPTEKANEFGEPEQTFRTCAVRWGSVEPLSGREIFLAAQVQEQVTHRIRMWNYDDLTSKHKLEVDGATFDIDTVLRGRGLTLQMEVLCKEQT